MDRRPVAELEAALSALATATSAEQRLPLLRDALEHLARTERELVELRDATVLALSQQGWTLQEIARVLGVTRGRVHQVVRARRAADKPSRITPKSGVRGASPEQPI